MKKYYARFNAWMDFNPPGALTSKGWRLFRDEFKEKAPIRFWITHTFRYKVTLPVKWKIERVTDWVRYRTVDKFHVLNTGLPPGYADKDTLMLNVNFNLLKDFVEVELAWRERCWGEGEKEDLNFVQKWVWCGRKISPYRNPALGIKRLTWEATLDDPALPPCEQSPEQARSAREQLELYNWWINRPLRKKINCGTYSEQGKDMGPLDDDFDKDAEDYKAYQEKMELSQEQELQWREEDTEMLLRLVKIRETLWS